MVTKDRVRPFWLSVLLWCSALPLSPAAAAQDVSVRAYLTPPNGVQVGRAFIVNLEVSGVQRFDEQPVVPNLEPYATYRGAGSSTNMQMVNGQTTVSLVVQVRYEAVQEGAFEIPAITLQAGGETHTTDPIRLTISPGAPAPAAGSSGNTDQTEAGIASTDLFITATPSKTTVLEGEPLVMEYRIWTRVDVSGYSVTTLPETAGFWVEELDQGQATTEQRERNGLRYVTAMVRRVALVPSGAGVRTIDPLEVEAQVTVRGQSSDPFERILGRSRLGRPRQITLRSNPVSLTVQSLPAGRPEPFSGIVGSLDLEASLDRDTVASNDAVTLTVRISGEGNLRTLPQPELSVDEDFEVFPPEVSTSTRRSGSGLSGTRTYEYVLIPRAPGDRTIPAIEMGYYDTGSGAYRTATTGDFDLTVTGTATDGVAARAGARGGVTELRRDVRFIRLGEGDLQPTRAGLFDNPVFWLLLLLPPLAVASSLGLRRHQDRLELDVAYARGRRAGRVAKKRFAEAKRLAVGDDPRAFFAEVARALRGLIADRTNLAEAGLQTADLQEMLAGRGVDTDTGSEVVSCLDHCDRQRFAPPTADVAERSKFLERASSLMNALDRDLRK